MVEAEPTPAPEVTLTGLRASRGEVAPGEAVEFSFEAANAEALVWSAERSDGLYGGSGRLEGGSFVWTPGRTGIYTVTVNASGNGLTVSQSCNVTVKASALSVSATAPSAYAGAGVRQVQYNLSLTGGVEPYAVNIAVKFNGARIFEANNFFPEVVCGAMGYGEHVLTIDVTDAQGESASASAVILGSNEEINEPPALPGLSKDMTFPERLVAIALSQVGYRESKTNFGYKEESGKVQGWTFYGDWYGMPYEEWCAMFASYCLEMAGVGEGILPRAANCQRWKVKLGSDYIDDEDDYIPEPGDLVFFHHDRGVDDPNFPNHVGIVVDYDAKKDWIYTVEGNSGFMVRERIHARESETIVGYVSLRHYMVRWDKAYKERLRQLVLDSRSERTSGESQLTAKNASVRKAE